jgi:hypothetical protein
MMRKFSTRYGMKATPVASGPVIGGSTNNLGAGSFSMGTTSDAALWAKALVASSAPAAMAASVLARMFTSLSLRLGTRNAKPL